MNSCLRLVSHRPAERMVVTMLRAAAAGDDAGGAGEDTTLTRLARLAVSDGLVLLAPGTPFISADEKLLLGCLALRQRNGLPGARIASRTLDIAVTRCAEDLQARGLRLPYLAVQRLSFADRQSGAAPIVAIAPQRRHRVTDPSPAGRAAVATGYK